MSIKILLELPYHCPLIAHDKGNDRAMIGRFKPLWLADVLVLVSRRPRFG